jgi:hypothetical protein
MNTEFVLHISKAIEGRLLRCRASVRTAIRARLGEIADGAGKARRGAKAPTRSVGPVKQSPPLRFYVYEGYRIFYRIDSGSRQVVVMDFGLVPANT